MTGRKVRCHNKDANGFNYLAVPALNCLAPLFKLSAQMLGYFALKYCTHCSVYAHIYLFADPLHCKHCNRLRDFQAVRGYRNGWTLFFDASSSAREVQQQMVGCKKRQALEFSVDHSAKQQHSGTPGYKNGHCCSVRPLGQTAILARCNH